MPPRLCDAADEAIGAGASDTEEVDDEVVTILALTTGAIFATEELFVDGRTLPRIDPKNPIHVGGTLYALRWSYYLQHGSESQFCELFRLKKDEFDALSKWARGGDHLRDTKYQTVEQKLMVFLWILAFGETQRNAAHVFQIAQSTVSSIVGMCLTAFVKLHEETVRQPEQEYVSPEIELSHKDCQFNGCIGAIDGTLVAAYLPLAQQKRFFNRKGFVSQNVFAAVRFDGMFSYVLAGAEGSMNDASLLQQALSRSFRVPEGRYYLADAGFGSLTGIVTPFPGERYHLNETAAAGQAPETAKEWYNLQHSRRRVIVEKAFGRVKKRWKILRASPPEYSFRDQARFVYAVTGLENFLLSMELANEAPLDDDKLFLLERARQRADRVVARKDGKVIRHNTAVWSWKAREAYLAGRDEAE